MKFRLFFFVLILNTSLIAQQATPPVKSNFTVDGITNDSVQVKRLVKLCELWGKVNPIKPIAEAQRRVEREALYQIGQSGASEKMNASLYF